MRQDRTPQHHDRSPGTRRPLASSLGAVACLFALVATLLLPMLHAWESMGEQHPVGAQAPALLTQPGMVAALRDRPSAPQEAAHDPLLCPICQLLSQARPLPHTPSVGGAYLEAHLRLRLPHLLWPASPDLTLGAPRAPPTLI